jgi:hypothetical protein
MQVVTRRPMNRADWAWLMACLICGFFVSFFLVGSEVLWERGPHYGTEYSSLAVNGKTVSESTRYYQYQIPVYTKKITIRTSGETKDIFQAVTALGRQDIEIRLEHTPVHLTSWGDFFGAFLSAVLFLVMVTGIIRIVEKSCRRLLGMPEEKNVIVRDPSTSSG